MERAREQIIKAFESLGIQVEVTGPFDRSFLAEYLVDGHRAATTLKRVGPDMGTDVHFIATTEIYDPLTIGGKESLWRRVDGWAPASPEATVRSGSAASIAPQIVDAVGKFATLRWSWEYNDGFVIRSLAEGKRQTEGALYWSNGDGWTSLEGATVFTASERGAVSLPQAHGGDAVWISRSELAPTSSPVGP